MTQVTIVAIPRNENPVWKVSSETVPHMTLLYLEGPMDVDVSEIVKYVEHAARTSLRRFGVMASNRGPLGPNDADVLFVDEEDAKPLRVFRSHLLKDDRIKKFWDETEQFPGWIPHLTLGYPDKPAKDHDYIGPPIWLDFDRIAVWTKDYSGAEFVLEPPQDVVFSHSEKIDDKTEIELYHFGVLGQRWGVRRALNSAGLVTGTVDDAIAKGQKPSSSRKPSKDHKEMKKALKRDVSSLSTSEIQELNKRLKAISQLNQTTAAQRKQNAPAIAKLTRWVAKSATDGARRTGEAWIQKMAGEIVSDLLPNPGGKKVEVPKPKIDKEKTNNENNSTNSTKPNSDPEEKPDSGQNGTKSREAEINDLVESIVDTAGVYDITGMPKKKGG